MAEFGVDLGVHEQGCYSLRCVNMPRSFENRDGATLPTCVRHDQEKGLVIELPIVKGVLNVTAVVFWKRRLRHSDNCIYSLACPGNQPHSY